MAKVTAVTLTAPNPTDDKEIKKTLEKILSLQEQIGAGYFAKMLPKTAPYGFPQSMTDAKGNKTLTGKQRDELFKQWQQLKTEYKELCNNWYYDYLTEQNEYLASAFTRLSKVSYMFGGIDRLITYLTDLHKNTAITWMQRNKDVEYWFASFGEQYLKSYSGFERYIACRLLADAYNDSPDYKPLKKRLLKEAQDNLPAYNVQYIDIYEPASRWYIWDVNPPYQPAINEIKEAKIEYNHKDPRIAPRLVIAADIIFEALNIEETDQTKRANLIRWLTGSNWKNLYDEYRNRWGKPGKKSGAMYRAEDVEFVLEQFKSAGLTSLLKHWAERQEKKK